MEEPFNGIKNLKGFLEKEKKLQIIHRTEIWEASFSWNLPTTRDAVKKKEKKIGKKFPLDLILFLTSISNGALLYYDDDFCQWGYKLYSVQEIHDNQRRFQDYFEEDWSPNFIGIGEVVDDRHVIVANIGNPITDGSGCELLEGHLIDRVQHWPKMSRSFNEWTNFLVVSQGAKFWDWCKIMSNFYKHG